MNIVPFSKSSGEKEMGKEKRAFTVKGVCKRGITTKALQHRPRRPLLAREEIEGARHRGERIGRRTTSHDFEVERNEKISFTFARLSQRSKTP